MSYYGYDEIARRKKRGYTFWLIDDPTTDETEHIDFAGVQSQAQFDARVARIGAHVLRVLDDLAAQSGSALDQVTIGKSYVTKNRAKPFDAHDGTTWKADGVRSRWNSRYNKPSWKYDGVIMIACFTRQDVPAVLATHRLDHQDLCLKYEQQLEAWTRANIGGRAKLSDGDDGGGGRRSKTHVGFVLYVAVRFA